MAVVEVTGLPNSVKMPKLIYIFRDILKVVDVKKFWIKELADMRNCDLKEVKVEFLTYEDARRAYSKLDNYTFTQSGEPSPLIAKILRDKGSTSTRSRQPPQRTRSRNETHSRHSQRYSPRRDRSRSPLYTESSKLDLEIELLRKQRLVIEEERRLLLERKKLELIREFGSSATKEFEHIERSRERERRLRPSRDERPVRRPEIRKSPIREPREPRSSVNSYSLPQFILPCKMLFAQMKEIIKEKCNMGEKTAIHKLLRGQFRRRIAKCLENKEYMPADQIVKLYREVHPVSTDEELVDTMVNNLRLSHWTVKHDGDAKDGERKKPRKDMPKKITEKKENNSETEVGNGDLKEELNNDSIEESMTELDELVPLTTNSDMKPEVEESELKPETMDSVVESEAQEEPMESVPESKEEPMESVPESKEEPMESVLEPEEIDMVQEPAESVQKPEPVPEPVQPVLEVPKPVQAVSKPVQTVPKPAQAVPKPVQAVPKPVQAVPKPVQAVPKPVQTVPKPVQEVPKPVPPVPKPVETAPQPSKEEINDSVNENADVTLELVVDGPDDDWIADGIDWNDDGEDEQE